MSLIGSSDSTTPVNLSLPERVVERLHYQAVHDSQKRAFQDGQLPVSPSVQYDGEELTEEEVELTENFVGWLLYDEVPRKYFRADGEQ
jgi:hypothetical protein